MEPDGSLRTYGELLADARAFFSENDSAGIFLLEPKNDYQSVVAYVAALIGDKPVYLREPRDQTSADPVLENFPITTALRGTCESRNLVVLPNTIPAEIHPEVCVLLSTSGSTGNPKLVKLSKTNIQSNADSIARYLEITKEDRACCILPFYYSYGLSVLNSHLIKGASLYLCQTPIADPEFISIFNTMECTSFAGVPYTFETLEKRSFGNVAMPKLKYCTQAGGKLSDDLVKHFSETLGDMGAKFYVMYGQTEASPRMAYLPPELALENPSAIGVPIPGGKLSLVDEDGKEVTNSKQVGELVYEGPNVMMGYALTADDLALEPGPARLETGDLALRTDAGLLQIVGRKSRFLKFSGTRIDLSDIEDRLRKAGYEGVATGQDGLLVLATVNKDISSEDRQSILRNLPILPAQMFALQLPEIPRLSTGKIDYPSLCSAGLTLSKARDKARGSDENQLIDEYKFIFPSAQICTNKSFNELSGDSLNYVQAASAIEQQLGYLPHNWENLTIGELAMLADPSDETTDKANGTNIGIELLVRAFAPVLVTLTHAGHTTSLGGAMLLYFLGGVGFWRFQREKFVQGKFKPLIKSYSTRILLPYFLMIGFLSLVLGMGNLRQFLPINNYFGGFLPPLSGTFLPYWFIETYLQTIVLILLLFCIPSVRKWTKNSPSETAWAFFAASVILSVASLIPLKNGWVFWPTPNMILHVFAVGILTCIAKSTTEKSACRGGNTGFRRFDLPSPSRSGFWVCIWCFVTAFVTDCAFSRTRFKTPKSDRPRRIHDLSRPHSSVQGSR